MSVPNLLRASVIVAGVTMLSACSTTSFRPVSDDQIKIGRPYAVRGVTYTPAEDPAFDVLGYARESPRPNSRGPRRWC